MTAAPVQQKLIEGRPAGFDVIGMADHAHAHRSVFEGNEPAPAVVEPARGMLPSSIPVSLVTPSKWPNAAALPCFLLRCFPPIGPDRNVSRPLCIDHDRVSQVEWTSLSILCMDQRGPAGPKLNAVGLGALVEWTPFGDRILGENVIEFGRL